MNKLNEHVRLLLSKHGGGKEFFDELDSIIRASDDILHDFIWQHALLDEIRTGAGIILTGSFGLTLISRLRHYLGFNVKALWVNGGIREGLDVHLFSEEDMMKTTDKWIFLDDSIYSGRTRDTIMDKMQSVNPNVRLAKTFVVYDGMKQHDDSVISMFRYHPPIDTMF